MNNTGYSMPQQPEPKTLLGKFNEFRKRYRIHAAVGLAVLTTLTLIAAQIFPAVKQYVLTSGFLEWIILIVVLDLAASVYLIERTPAIRIMRNQDESMPILIGALRHCRGQTVDLIEYAGHTTLPLIRAIERAGVNARILVVHPETVAGVQMHRNIGALDSICNSVFGDKPDSLEIRCYKLPYGLRGRRMGNELLELCWLTPDTKRHTTFGHGNPSVVADLSDHSNDHLRIFFEKTFETLWSDPGTEDGRAVLERLTVTTQPATQPATQLTT